MRALSDSFSRTDLPASAAGSFSLSSRVSPILSATSVSRNEELTLMLSMNRISKDSIFRSFISLRSFSVTWSLHSATTSPVPGSITSFARYRPIRSWTSTEMVLILANSNFLKASSVMRRCFFKIILWVSGSKMSEVAFCPTNTSFEISFWNFPLRMRTVSL